MNPKNITMESVAAVTAPALHPVADALESTRASVRVAECDLRLLATRANATGDRALYLLLLPEILHVTKLGQLLTQLSEGVVTGDDMETVLGFHNPAEGEVV